MGALIAGGNTREKGWSLKKDLDNSEKLLFFFGPNKTHDIKSLRGLDFLREADAYVRSGSVL